MADETVQGISAFISRNVEEIRADKALRFYGACLAISYLATSVFFILHRQYLYLTTSSDSLCWPLLPGCYAYHVFSVPQAIAVVGLLGFLAAAFALYFLMGEARAGWTLLLAAFVLDGLIICQDFRFRLNEHYMLLWATVAFLFFPRKRQALSFLILSFYVWAGRIKINQDWLSGSELPHRLWLIPVSGYPTACAYVIVLEMVVVWALVQPRKWLFWAAFAQFALFHAISWSIVGFFYPILMAGIISIYPLSRLIPVEPRSDLSPDDLPRNVLPRNDLNDLLHLRQARSLYALLAVFAALQLVPFLYPGGVSWTSQGRLFSLHMFEGRSSCRISATEKFKNRPARMVELFRRDLPMRDICDPLVYFNEAQRICRELPAQDPDFVDLDLKMVISKRMSPTWRPLVDTDDFCSKHLRYNPFLPNDWILPVTASTPGS
jgi:hypothetical protein